MMFTSWYSPTANKPALLLTAVLALGGCLSEEKVEDDGSIGNTIELSGSVGDGPVVAATMHVRDRVGSELAAFESGALASYNISVDIVGADFPLTVDSSGGTDLVTGLAPDFDLEGAVFRAEARSVSNVNPFSTFAVELARNLSGGLTAENLEDAQIVVTDQLNSGLTTLATEGAMQTHIDEHNIAEIVKASETLSEIVRRTRDLLNGAGYTTNADLVIDALAADLTDDVIDGRGAAAVDSRTAALSTLVGAQVLMESMANRLFVNGSLATDRLTRAINDVSVRAPTVVIEDLPVTAGMTVKARVGFRAAVAVDADAAVASLAAAVDGIQAGMDAALVRSLLPSGYRNVLQNTLVNVASADQSVIDTINAIARGEDVNSPVNRAPTISGTPPTMVEAGAAYQFTPTANDPDGDSLTFTALGLPVWAALNASTGRISGTPGAADVGTTNGIVVTVSDGELTASLAAFSITVFEGNQAPTISGSPPTSIVAGQGYAFTPTASDPNGDALSFTISNPPSWATFNPNNGRLTGAPFESDVGNYPGIVITVSDGQLTDSIGPFAIDVTSANSAPQISGTPPQSVTAGQSYSFTPTASDADGDALTFSVSNLPSWASFSTANGRISGTPSAGDVGNYPGIVITVSDGQLTDSLGPFAIEVTAANSAPRISGTPPQSVTAGQPYSFTPTASDADGDPLTFSSSNLPSWASFSTANGRISGTPSAGDVGTYSGITITVSDGQASDTLGPFTITVDAISLGSVTLDWTAPTLNEDGSALTDLAGYRLYWGTSAGSYTQSVTINNPSVLTYTVDNLSPDTYYFVVTAFDATGTESRYSGMAIRVVP